MAKPLHEYDFHRSGTRVAPDDVDWDADLYLSEHFTELMAIDYLRVVAIDAYGRIDILVVRDDGYAYPKGVPYPEATAVILAGWKKRSDMLSRTGRLKRRAVDSLVDEMKATGRIKVRMLPDFPGLHRDSSKEEDPAQEEEVEAGFLRNRVSGYGAAIRVERYRTAAEELQAEDPDTFWRIVARADGSDAEVAARRDPVAYVALFMAAADDAGVGTSD